MLSGRLPETAATALAGGVEALDAVRLQVGRPVRPMLASPGSSLDAALADLGADVTVEFKLDGARIQVHRDGDDVRVWTRTLREVTDGVPELVERVRALPCRTAVLDGETLALDDDGRPRAFQDTMSRFGSDASDARACCSARSSSTCCTSTAATCSTSRCTSASTRSPGCWPTTSTPRCGCPASAGPSPEQAAERAGRRARRRPRGRGRQGAGRPVRRRPARARRGRRSSRCTPSTSSCSARSGGTAAAPGSCRTSTWAPATPTAASRSWWARRSRG